MSKLIDSYIALLTEVGLEVKENGTVTKKGSPHFVKSKPLALPLASVFRDPTVQDKIIFHPFAESSSKGESDVLEDLRNRFKNIINLSTARFIGFLLAMATGEIKLTLSPEQSEVMKVLVGVDEKASRDIMQIVEATTKGEGRKTPLVRIYLSRKPTIINKVKNNRTGVVFFPLYDAAKEELKNKTKGFSLLGVQVNKKTLEALIRIYEYIFQGIEDDPECYNFGSPSLVAPYADALLKTVGGLYGAINDRVRMFKGIAPIIEKILLNDNWCDEVSNIDDMFIEIQKIPLQPNADGKTRIADLEKDAVAIDMQNQPKPVDNGPVQVAAPAMTTMSQQAQSTSAPVNQPGANEPEWIMTENGKRTRNPNFLRPIAVGGNAGMLGSLDPYGVGVSAPAGLFQMTQQQMMATPAGGNVTANNQAFYNVPYGVGVPQQYHQMNRVSADPYANHNGGRLPGLSY